MFLSPWSFYPKEYPSLIIKRLISLFLSQASHVFTQAAVKLSCYPRGSYPGTYFLCSQNSNISLLAQFDSYFFTARVRDNNPTFPPGYLFDLVLSLTLKAIFKR